VRISRNLDANFRRVNDTFIKEANIFIYLESKIKTTVNPKQLIQQFLEVVREKQKGTELEIKSLEKLESRIC
jgi:FtsZ-binding cell division protein ZapB